MRELLIHQEKQFVTAQSVRDAAFSLVQQRDTTDITRIDLWTRLGNSGDFRSCDQLIAELPAFRERFKGPLATGYSDTVFKAADDFLLTQCQKRIGAGDVVTPVRYQEAMSYHQTKMQAWIAIANAQEGDERQEAVAQARSHALAVEHIAPYFGNIPNSLLSIYDTLGDEEALRLAAKRALEPFANDMGNAALHVAQRYIARGDLAAAQTLATESGLSKYYGFDILLELGKAGDASALAKARQFPDEIFGIGFESSSYGDSEKASMLYKLAKAGDQGSVETLHDLVMHGSLDVWQKVEYMAKMVSLFEDVH